MFARDPGPGHGEVVEDDKPERKGFEGFGRHHLPLGTFTPGLRALPRAPERHHRSQRRGAGQQQAQEVRCLGPKDLVGAIARLLHQGGNEPGVDEPGTCPHHAVDEERGQDNDRC